MIGETNKPKGSIDIDGVLANFRIVFLGLAKQLYGISLSQENVTDYDLTKYLAQKHINGIYEKMTEDRLYERLPIIPGAAESVERLAKEYDLMINTGRPEKIQDQTRTWLKLFPVVFDPIFFTNGTDKKHKLTSSRCAFHLDDLASEIRTIEHTRILPVLFDQPHNQTYVTGDVYNTSVVSQMINNYHETGSWRSVRVFSHEQGTKILLHAHIVNALTVTQPK